VIGGIRQRFEPGMNVYLVRQYNFPKVKER